MDPSSVTAAKSFVEALKADPSLLHKPELAFLRDYLLSLNATIPDPPAKSNLNHVTSLADWDALVASSAGKPIVVDAFATWCPPCKAIAPLFEKLADEHSPDVVFAKIDVDQAKDFAAKFTISAMPTFKVFRGGEEVDELVGADPNKLAKLVEAAKAGTTTPSADDVDEDHLPPLEDNAVEEKEETPETTDEEDVEEEEDAEAAERALLAELEHDPDVLPIDQRDNDPEPVPMGDPSASPSEADMDNLISLKSTAAEQLSSGNLDSALTSYNSIIEISVSPLTLAKRADVFLKLKRPYAAIRDCDAALATNPDSAKSLKIRGMAYRLLGEWEKAAHDLQKGNALDYDETSGAVQRAVEEKWNQIREMRLQRDAKARERGAKKAKQEREKARAEAIRRYEEAKKAEAEAEASRGMPGGVPGGMPCGASCGTSCGMSGGTSCGTPDGMPGGIPRDMPGGGIESMLDGLDLPDDVQEKLSNPEIKAKLVKVFSELQSNPTAAMGTAMKYMNDPDVGPIFAALMKGMMGGAGGPNGGAGMGGMGGMDGGMGGMGDGTPGSMPNTGEPSVEEVD